MKKIKIVANPHQGFDLYRRGGQVFTGAERTLEVRTEFAELEKLQKRHARALEAVDQEDEDAVAHLKIQQEQELEAERVRQLGPDQITPTQLKALQDDPRIKFVTEKKSESEAPPPPPPTRGGAEPPPARR